MTTTYEPKHALYLDEADIRGEMTRVFGVCNGCRSCIDLCSTFPTLFEMIERHQDQDAGRLTPAQQDRVVDECVQCKLCSDNCPYTAAHDVESLDGGLDFPRLVLRGKAMQHDVGITSLRSRAATQIAGRADLVGRAATLVPSLVNRLFGASPPFAEQRFSRWFTNRSRPLPPADSPVTVTVTIFPTCLVEYRQTDIGIDLVNSFEQRGVECSISAAGCCGAPWLHTGDVGRFTRVARKNVERLAAEIRRGNGTDIVVPLAKCLYVLTNDYASYVGGDDAALVTAHAFDAAAYEGGARSEAPSID